MFCSRTHRSHIRGDLPADPPAPSACTVSLGDLCWAFGSGVAVAGLITSHTPGTGGRGSLLTRAPRTLRCYLFQWSPLIAITFPGFLFGIWQIVLGSGPVTGILTSPPS